MEDHNHKLLEITTRNPQLCGIAMSGAGCVGGRRGEEDGGRKSEEGIGGRKEGGKGWRREE